MTPLSSLALRHSLTLDWTSAASPESFSPTTCNAKATACSSPWPHGPGRTGTFPPRQQRGLLAWAQPGLTPAAPPAQQPPTPRRAGAAGLGSERTPPLAP